MLHILSRSLHNDPVLYQRACEALQAGDALIFIGEGVISICGLTSDLRPKTADVHLYVLEEDLQVRGLLGEESPDISIINMDDFVALTEKHPTSISWY